MVGVRISIPMMAERASASMTIGVLHFLTNSFTASIVSGSFPIPGPIRTAS